MYTLKVIIRGTRKLRLLIKVIKTNLKKTLHNFVQRNVGQGNSTKVLNNIFLQQSTQNTR